MATQTPTIRVGWSTLYLDQEALEEGKLRLERGTISARCRDCNGDIVDHSHIVTVGREENSRAWKRAVKCSCGRIYTVEWKEIS